MTSLEVGHDIPPFGRMQSWRKMPAVWSVLSLAVLIPCHNSSTIGNVEVISLKLERRQLQLLKDQANASGRSQAAVIRELIDRYLAKARPSLHDRAADLCGTVSGAKDTSTRALKGYGRD